MRRIASHTLLDGEDGPAHAHHSLESVALESMRRAVSFTTLSDLAHPSPTLVRKREHLVIKLQRRSPFSAPPPPAPKLRPVDHVEDILDIEPLDMSEPFILDVELPPAPKLGPVAMDVLHIPALALPPPLCLEGPSAQPFVAACKRGMRSRVISAATPDKRAVSFKAVRRSRALRHLALRITRAHALSRTEITPAPAPLLDLLERVAIA
eukprot:CAMPEP_0206033084 /NCGR_PEP_ID=MMETSP1466-20131121/390_1 /ASSEMBLY_ACC=CAM_ASM_001126 /TAXON_ID=44452 /ORGANISM="Pavlova gyrans, Strain CCMP608" /LENGTH=208 /DNA_ID=CAMNT_0053407247 /DNA_START=50 /DNA_END=676 /DNA_ORIENTATION=+